MQKQIQKNPTIERVGRNTIRIGKMLVSYSEYVAILNETKEILKDFNQDFLINWEETKKA